MLNTYQRCWCSQLMSDLCGVGKQGARSGSGTIAAAHGHDDAAGGGANQQVWQEPVLISIACMPFDVMRAHLNNELKPSDRLRPAIICFWFMRSGAAVAANRRQGAGGSAAAAPPAAAVREVAAAAGGHKL